MVTVLLVLQMILSVALIAVVLLQRSKGEGLGSIGGGGRLFYSGRERGAEALLEKVTTYLAVAFIVLSALLALVI